MSKGSVLELLHILAISSDKKFQISSATAELHDVSDGVGVLQEARAC
jgi:hypothetical protein